MSEHVIKMIEGLTEYIEEYRDGSAPPSDDSIDMELAKVRKNALLNFKETVEAEEKAEEAAIEDAIFEQVDVEMLFHGVQRDITLVIGILTKDKYNGTSVTMGDIDSLVKAKELLGGVTL